MCHLSPFLFKLIQCRVISSLHPFHKVIFLFLYHEFFPPSLPSSLALHFGDHPRLHLSCGQSLSDSLYLSKWRSLVGLFFFGWVSSRGTLTFHISSDLSLLISATGSQLLMKSQSVPVDSDMVLGQRILASCSCFSVMSFNFQFTGVEGVWKGEVVPFFFSSWFSFFIFETLWPLQFLGIRHLCFHLSILWAMNVSPTVQICI